MRRAIALLALAVSFGALAAAPAQAADPAKAKVLMNEARDAVKAGQLDDAIAKLKEAQKFLEHPAILFAQARVYAKMLRLDLAVAALDRAQSDFELPRKLKAAVDAERAEIAALAEKYGQLRVTVEPKDADVAFDGAKHRGGFDRWIEPGKRRIEITAPGYAPAVRPATVEAGKLAEVKVVLRELTGSVRVVAPGGLKGVKVMLDGREATIDSAQRAGEIATIEATAGAHEVVCVRGKRRHSQVLKVMVDKTVDVRCEGVAIGLGGNKAVVGWGGVAVGAVLAGLGGYHINGYFGDVARTEGGDKEHYVASSDRAYGGTAFLVSGLAIGVTSYLLFVREPPPTGPGSTASGTPRSQPLWAAHGAVSDPPAAASR